MPQEQHVVRCYACKKFQVQIVKKAPKWQCKVCTAKQSLLKVYAQGSGKDCRLHVQNLNMQQGLMSEETPETPDYESTPHFEDQSYNDNPVFKNKASKWSEYIDNNSPSQATFNTWEEDDTSGNIPKTAGRKRKLSNQDNYEDYSSYEQSWQPEAEVLDLSSGPCATDILKNLHVIQSNIKQTVSPQPEFSGFTSSKSKWSEFVSPKEQEPAAPGDENPGTLWTKSVKHNLNATAAYKTSVPFANRNSHKQNVMENHSNESSSFGYNLSTKDAGKSISSASVKNPFCTVNDDDNLDTLLEF